MLDWINRNKKMEFNGSSFKDGNHRFEEINFYPKNKEVPQVLSKYPEPHNIIERKIELDDFHKLVGDENNKIIVVTGFGGVGKTTFVAAYREKYKEKFKHLAWISCITTFNYNKDEKISIIKLISESIYNDSLILSKLEISKPNDNNLQEFLAALLDNVIDKLDEIKELSLLVIDNLTIDKCDDINALHDKLASLNDNWKILITSRENLPFLCEKYELGFLSLEQARQLFYLYYKREIKDELVEEIVQIVGLHTLTIELLAKTAQANRSLNLTNLKKLLNTEGLNISKAVLIKTTFDKVKTETYIFECLTAAFAMVTGLKDSKRNCLLQFSVLPSSYISYDELVDFLKITDEEIFNDNLNFLRDRGLINEAEDGSSFKCHQVLQEVIREQLKPTTEDCKNLIDSLIAKLEYDPIANTVEKAKYLPLAESVLHGINEENLLLASLSHNMNDVYDAIGEYNKAFECELKAIAIRERLNNNSLDLAQSYNNIGVSYRRQNKLTESLQFHRKSLSIRKKLLDKHHLDISQSYSNMANVYFDLKNIKHAIKLYILALNILQKKLTKDNNVLANIAHVYYDLGACFLALSDYSSSEELQKKSLEIQKSIYDKSHPEIIASMKTLGIILYYQNKYYEAIELLEQVFELQKSLYKYNHPFIIDTMKILKFFFNKTKQTEKEAYFEKIIIEVAENN